MPQLCHELCSSPGHGSCSVMCIPAGRLTRPGVGAGSVDAPGMGAALQGELSAPIRTLVSFAFVNYCSRSCANVIVK